MLSLQTPLRQYREHCNEEIDETLLLGVRSNHVRTLEKSKSMVTRIKLRQVPYNALDQMVH